MTVAQQFWIGVIDKVAWPGSFFLTAVVCLLILKAPIGALINRLKSFRYGRFGAGTTEMGATQEIPAQAEKTPEAQLDHLGEIANLAKSYKSVPSMAAHIRQLLESNKGAPIADKTISDLVFVLALVATQRNFELVYSVIHGSQIRLLRRLLETPAGLAKKQLSEHMAMLRTFYKDAFEGMSEAQYMQWLVVNGLVHVSDEAIHLTAAGDDFLRWIHEARRSTDRPY